LQVIFFRLRIHRDGQQRSGVHLRRQFRLPPGSSDKGLRFHRLSELFLKIAKPFFLETDFFDFPGKAPDFIRVDLAVGFDRIDHRPQNQLRILFELFVFGIGLGLEQPHRNLRFGLSAALQRIKGKGSEQRHQTAPDGSAH